MSSFENPPEEIKIGMLMGKIGRLHATRADQVGKRFC